LKDQPKIQCIGIAENEKECSKLKWT